MKDHIPPKDKADPVDRVIEARLRQDQAAAAKVLADPKSPPVAPANA